MNSENKNNLPKKSNKYVEYAKEHIHSNIYEKVVIVDISNSLNISKAYFNRKFKEFEGVTPYTYVLNLKIEKAKELLEEGEDISNIALKIGFFDQSHLNRIFKRVVKMTPNEYKKLFYTI
ncbi:MAG: AraC family transcriptional regulator [Campylobacterota bacterium]|nr:AraC family transcriptional regulator [Campylobacterota bacterium]